VFGDWDTSGHAAEDPLGTKRAEELTVPPPLMLSVRATSTVPFVSVLPLVLLTVSL